MISMVPMKSIEQFNNLSAGNKQLVLNLIDHLSHKQKKKKIDWLGLLSLRFDWFCPNSKLTDDQVDEIIASVRAERKCKL